MAWPRIFQRLFGGGGTGPLLRGDIVPIGRYLEKSANDKIDVSYGIYACRKVATGDDLDNYKTADSAGFWWHAAADNPANAPVANAQAWLDVIYYTDSFVQQRWWPLTASQGVHYRTYLSGGWSAWQKVSGSGGASAPVGAVELLPFRYNELPFGWYFANGERYALTSAAGTALNALSANYKTDWSITISNDTISIPNYFTDAGTGAFPRAVDGVSRSPGSLQSSAVQNHTHAAPMIWGNVLSGLYLTSVTYGNYAWGQYSSYTYGMATGNTDAVETRPSNLGMTPAIYLGV